MKQITQNKPGECLLKCSCKVPVSNKNLYRICCHFSGKTQQECSHREKDRRQDYVSRRLQKTGSDNVDMTRCGKPCQKHRGDWKSSVTMVENQIWQTVSDSDEAEHKCWASFWQLVKFAGKFWWCYSMPSFICNNKLSVHLLCCLQPMQLWTVVCISSLLLYFVSCYQNIGSKMLHYGDADIGLEFSSVWGRTGNQSTYPWKM